MSAPDFIYKATADHAYDAIVIGAGINGSWAVLSLWR